MDTSKRAVKSNQSSMTGIKGNLYNTNQCIQKHKLHFIRLYQKICWSYFDELRVTDSTLNKGTNSRVMSE